MPVDADTVAAAVTETLEYLDRIADRGWVAREDGLFAWRTGVALPTLNGVLIMEPDRADEHVVASLLDRLAEDRLPYSLQARPAGAEKWGEPARSRNLAADSAIPLMALEHPDRLPRALATCGVAIRAAERQDIELLVTVGAAGFQAPEKIFRGMVTEAAFELEGARGYLGYCNNRPVATGMGVTIGDFVGIFNISTIPGYRQRGFGAAMTARAVLDGLQAGARWAWLQSSSAGRNVYRRLGFRDVEEWACWLGNT
jgi:ribosomal protein S18 acetylase RimI-like enzyme